MSKQVKLTENELRQLIRESVQASLNEAGWGDRFRNLGNKLKKTLSEKRYGSEKEVIPIIASQEEESDEEPSYLSNYDTYEPVNIDNEEPRNETPYSYSQQPSQTITPNPINMDDWNGENYSNHDEEGESNGLFNQEEPETVDLFANNQPQQDEQPQNTQQKSEQPVCQAFAPFH